MTFTPTVEKKSKNEIKVIFKNIDVGFCNLLKKKLWSYKETESTGFRVTHPQVGEVEFFLKTKGKDAKSIWNSAISDLSKEFSKIK